MPSLLHRLGVVGLVFGGAVLTSGACGGAATSDLDDPPGVSENDSSVKAGKPDATGGSSSGGDHDAMAHDDVVDVDPVDATLDTGTGSMDDASDMAPDAGSDGGSICGPCAAGNRCCTSKGAVSYAQCYNQFVCPLCCP
jgi:hypothetical protein